MGGTIGNNNNKQEGDGGGDDIAPEPIDATAASEEDTAAVVAAAAAAVMEATEATDEKVDNGEPNKKRGNAAKTNNGTHAVHQQHQHYPAQQQHQQPWPYPQHPYYYPPHPHHYPHVPPPGAAAPHQQQPAQQQGQQQTQEAQDQQGAQQQPQPGAVQNNEDQPQQQVQNQQESGKNAQPYTYAQQQQKPPQGYPPAYHYNPYYPHYPPPGYQHQVQPPAASNAAQTAATGADRPAATAAAGVPPPMADVTDNNTSPASKKRKKDNKNKSIPFLLVDADPRVPPSNKLLYSHSGLGIGAFVRLEGLLTREAYNVRDPYDRSFEGYGGKVIGYDPALQRWSIKVEFRHARSPMPYQAILQCLPQNMYVEEMAPQRNPTDGSILLDRNAGGFAVVDRHLLWDCEERADKEDWTGNQVDSAGTYRSLSREEEYIIREALFRINDCSRQLIPFLDETKKQYMKPEIYNAMSRGRDIYKWPRDRLCGGNTGAARRSGPHSCGMAAIFGPQHNRCLCEYCFCGYIGKAECTCNAVYWALCSTMGWTQEIKDFDIQSVRSTVVYAARQVAMYPPFRLFDTHYPGLSEEDSSFQTQDKAKEGEDDNGDDKDTSAEKEKSEDETNDKTMPEEQERHKKEIEEKGIRWEAEVLPGVWRRYQPFLESRIEQLYNMGSPHYLYRPGNKAVEGTFLNLPDGHGRAPPDTVATRRVLFQPQWREIEMQTGLCARVRRTGPPTKDADGSKATTDDAGTEERAAEAAAATEGDPAAQSEKGENDPSSNKDTETETARAAEDKKEGTADSATPVSGEGEDTVEPLSLDQSNTQEAES